MSFQYWSVIYLLAVIPTVMILERIESIKSAEGRRSRQYYSTCLISVISWDILDFALTNLSEDQALLAGAINRFNFFLVALAVFCFVTSSIYFTRVPRLSERLFVMSPIILILIVYLAGPFQLRYAATGWQGDIVNPVLRYSWLAIVIVVMAYSFARLNAIRTSVTDSDAKRRLTFFSAGFAVALVLGVVLYLTSQVVPIPELSSISVNLSLLIGYPAFSRHKVAAEL